MLGSFGSPGWESQCRPTVLGDEGPPGAMKEAVGVPERLDHVTPLAIGPTQGQVFCVKSLLASGTEYTTFYKEKKVKEGSGV